MRETSGSWNTGHGINGSDMPLTLTGYDIVISFNLGAVHEVGDKWEFEQGAMKGLSIADNRPPHLKSIY